MKVGTLERMGQLALGFGTVLSLWLVPQSGWTQGSAPETRALYSFLLTLAMIPFFHLHRLGPRVERVWFAVFLAAMPLIYLEAGWRAGVPLGLELLGLCVFAPMAVAGMVGSPWWLVVGIVLHGLAWDSWHLHRGVVGDWYAEACAVIDVSLAGYLAGRLQGWTRSFPLQASNA